MRSLILLLIATPAIAQSDAASLKKALVLHAPFDGSANAAFAKGDPVLYSTQSTKRTDAEAGLKGDVKLLADAGRTGGCLHFTKKGKWFPFFKGEGNFSIPEAGKPFAGTVSFWMKLNPAKDLEPGFVDPIQITDKKWNDASFFLDFTKENPRQFRLGCYSNYKFWNPKALKYEEVPDSKRPLGIVKKLSFSNDQWTHVAFTWEDFNTNKPGRAVLYLDGRPAAKVDRPQRFDWNPKDVSIMLGIGYVGKIDDLSVFNRALTEAELQRLFKMPDGVVSLYR
ncbi:MAG: LamG domain-containing protein [Planctomycetaceae bacterium]